MLLLAAQCGITFILVFTIYMLLALMDSDLGFEGWIGLLMFQPLMGGIAAALTVGVCFVLGCPIRFHDRLNLWWRSQACLAPLIALSGLLLLAASFWPPWRETIIAEMDVHKMSKQIPNTTLLGIGWFMAALE